MRTLWAGSFALALLGGAVLVSRAQMVASHALSVASARRSQAAHNVVASSAASNTPFEAPPPPAVDARVALGQALFFDPSLSEPPGTSCAACHEPQHGYAGLNGSTHGVPRGSRVGHFARRTAPSLMYLRFVPRFHVEWEDEAQLPEARGGFFWDGRVSSVGELPRQPLLNPDEMANPSLAAVARKVAAAPYAAQLRGEITDAFASTEQTIVALSLCLEAFLTSRALAPFSSAYDDFVRGDGQLSALELRGLSLFKDTEKGSCNSCHRLDDASHEPERSLFTDFGYDTVAAPRNNRAGVLPGRFDLGLCERHDARLHTEDAWYCGAFRTPSLRNVALRESFFHNGAFTSLRDVVRFYATRGTSPEAWYARGAFDDLPPQYWRYVNTTIPPYNRVKGDAPALDDAEIDAIVAFLGTLTDRKIPPRP